MNHSLFFLLLILAIFSSCNSEKGGISHLESAISSFTEEDSMECYSSYEIYGETAVFWSQSWVSYYNSSDLSESYSTSPEVNFSKINVFKLKNNFKYSEGVILYYILMDSTDIIPSLAMVPLEGCNPILSDSATSLVSVQGALSEFFVDSTDLSTYRNYWKEKGNKEFIHTPVYGYNYKWDVITENTTTDFLYVKYGLRTLGPGDTAEFTTEPSSEITGSIVYCNVIYDVEPASSIIDRYDFAAPCPIYCN